MLLVHSPSVAASFKPGAHDKGARGKRSSPSAVADDDYSHRPRETHLIVACLGFLIKVMNLEYYLKLYMRRDLTCKRTISDIGDIAVKVSIAMA